MPFALMQRLTMDPVASLLKEPFTRLSRRYLKLLAAGEITAGELVVLLVVADKTVSWRRLWAKLSYTDLTKMTGMTRKGLGVIIERLVQANLIARKPVGRSFAYALVPKYVTAAQLLDIAGTADVDNLGQAAILSSTSGNSHRLPQVDDPAVLSFVFKKRLKKAAGAAVLVDNGLRARASITCRICSGAGWVFSENRDGSSSAAPCPCTSTEAA